MTPSSRQTDLVVLAADKCIEMALRGLLSRTESLRIRPLADDAVEYLVHPEHDPGCARTPEMILRPYARDSGHALVVMDHEGSGCERIGRTDLELRIEERLAKNGWDENPAAAIVIEPELENWIWSNSPAVAEGLGWEGQSRQLRSCLEEQGLWRREDAKPSRPKETMRWALREVRKPWSASIHGRLAKSVRLEGCSDPAFQKLCRTLQSWFGEGHD